MKAKQIVFLMFLLWMTTVSLVKADVNVNVYVFVQEDGKVNVQFQFLNLNSTVYNSLNRSQIAENISETIRSRFENLEYSVDWVGFDDNTSSVYLNYTFWGDILTVELDKDKMRQIYTLETFWRKTEFRLTENFTLNLEDYFGRPPSEWNKTECGYVINAEDGSSKFVIIGPQGFLDHYLQENTDAVIFEGKAPTSEYILNSPIFVLISVLVVVLIAVVYRKIRYG